MRVTTTNRTSKLQTPVRTKTSSTTILNEQTGHLQNGTTIVSPTSSNNVIFDWQKKISISIFVCFFKGTLRLIDSGDYLSTAISPPQQQQPVATSAMLQFLQPSSNAIQNMLIQQILTSPEQVHNSCDVTGQHMNIYLHICAYASLSFFIKRLCPFMKLTISVFSYWGYEQYGLLCHFFLLSTSFFDVSFVIRQTSRRMLLIVFAYKDGEKKTIYRE